MVSRSAFSTPAGKFGAGRLSLHYRELGIWGKEVWEEEAVEAWGPKRVLQLNEGETGGSETERRSQSLYLLGSLRGVWATKRWVKVSAQNGRALGLRKG